MEFSKELAFWKFKSLKLYREGDESSKIKLKFDEKFEAWNFNKFCFKAQSSFENFNEIWKFNKKYFETLNFSWNLNFLF